jgi:hypothetical protein
MVKLKADFEADWIAGLRAHMIQVQGWAPAEVESLDDRDVPIHYFESRRRRLAPQARTLKIADNFRCPSEKEAGWKALQDKVRKGEDLNPHLSSRHAFLLNRDGLLAEWGVHHFHLGTKRDPKNPAFVKRTGPLVYALVDDNTFCAINVYTHNDFEEGSIVESIHRNWPDMISKYQMKDVTGGVWDKTQRRTLRSKNANVFVTTAGGTVYMPISGGVMASGVNSEAVRDADYWQMEIRSFQTRFEDQLADLLPTLAQQGYAGEEELEAELRIVEIGYQVFFPKYEVLANIVFAPVPPV